MKTLLTWLAALLLPITVAVASEKSPKAPEYPGQPSINAALKHLAQAKEAIDKNKDDAIAFLKKAYGSLESTIKDKGNYRTTAIRWTKEAIKHLEESDTAKASKDIDEAIDDVHKAGKIGSK